MKLTMVLSKEDVVNILGEHLATKGYRIDPNTIEFRLETKYYGCENGYEETVFDGATMDCEVGE